MAGRVARLTAGVIAAFYWVAGTVIIALLTSIAEVRVAAADYLIWVVVSPAVCVWAFTYDGVFLGATRTRVLRDTMIMSFAVYMAGVFLAMPVIGNHGLWLGLMLFLSCRALFQVIAYPALRRSIG